MHRSDTQGVAEVSDEFILGRKKVDIYLLFVEQFQSTQILLSITPFTSPCCCPRPPPAKSLTSFMFTHCHWSRRADGSCKTPVFMIKPSKNWPQKKKKKLGELPKRHLESLAEAR